MSVAGNDASLCVDLEPALFKVGIGGECHLVGGKCSECGTVTWGLRQMCPECWAEGTQQETPIGRKGKLYSATTVRHAPPGFTPPYVMGAIDLDEGLRVIARVILGPSSFAKDVDVVLEAGRLGVNNEGAQIIGPVFRVKM